MIKKGHQKAHVSLPEKTHAFGYPLFMIPMLFYTRIYLVISFLMLQYFTSIDHSDFSPSVRILIESIIEITPAVKWIFDLIKSYVICICQIRHVLIVGCTALFSRSG